MAEGRAASIAGRGNRCPRVLRLAGAQYVLEATRQPVWLESRQQNVASGQMRLLGKQGPDGPGLGDAGENFSFFF